MVAKGKKKLDYDSDNFLSSSDLKPRTGAKGKKTLDYDSNDVLSSNDLTPKVTIVKSSSDIMVKHSVKELLKKF